MSAYLFRLLSSSRAVSPTILLRALERGVERKISLAEALVSIDPQLAGPIAGALRDEGADADAAWRPDSYLLAELPPGLCEHSLAFPFRERAGKVEVATLCPGDEWVRSELEAHLQRPVVLYRAGLQALLAAAHSPVDLEALAQISDGDGQSGDEALPLVRKSVDKAPKKKTRTPTSPGLGNRGVTPAAPVEVRLLRTPSLGEVSIQTQSHRPEVTARPPTWVSPNVVALDGLERARNARDVCHALSVLLPAPALFFELGDGRLSLVLATGAGAYSEVRVSLVQASGLATAVEDGSYLGPFYDCPAHAHFFATFAVDTFVRIERIGSMDQGVIAVTTADFDVQRASKALHAAALNWERIQRRGEFLRGG